MDFGSKRGALTDLERASATIDLRRAKTDPVAAPCTRCSKWKFLTDLKAVAVTGDGGDQADGLLCVTCYRAIRFAQNRTAELRHNLDRNTILALSRLHKVSIDNAARSVSFRAHLIGLDEVLALWIAQDGLCALSGIKMRIDLIGSGDKRIPSLDRIDSSRGYEPGNVQWTCWAANLMKQNMKESEFIRWCKRIGTHHKDK